jgi:uncharacterized protein YegP (UPF0339 family)
MMQRPRFEIRPAASQRAETEWYWRLVGANGEVVATSHPETFQYPTDARAAAKNARRLARLAKVER